MVGHDIAVVGASAGGVQAILTLVGSLPPGLQASVFITEHLAPRPPSVLAAVFARAARLPVLTAEDGDDIRPATVYVAPADQHLLVQPGRIWVVRGPKENGHRPAIVMPPSGQLARPSAARKMHLARWQGRCLARNAGPPSTGVLDARPPL